MDNQTLYNIRYDTDHQITCSKFEIMCRICNIFSEFVDFDWTGTILAGKLVNALVLKNYDEKKQCDYSIDLLFFDKKIMCRVFDYFKKKFNTMYSFGHIGSNVVNIIYAKYDRPIRLIGLFKNYSGDPKEKLSFVVNFDPEYQVIFDGDNCFSTTSFMDKCVNRGFVTNINSTKYYIPSVTQSPAYIIAKIIHHYDNPYIIKNNDLCEADPYIFS